MVYVEKGWSELYLLHPFFVNSLIRMNLKFVLELYSIDNQGDKRNLEHSFWRTYIFFNVSEQSTPKIKPSKAPFDPPPIFCGINPFVDSSFWLGVPVQFLLPIYNFVLHVLETYFYTPYQLLFFVILALFHLVNQLLKYPLDCPKHLRQLS